MKFERENIVSQSVQVSVVCITSGQEGGRDGEVGIGWDGVVRMGGGFLQGYLTKGASAFPPEWHGPEGPTPNTCSRSLGSLRGERTDDKETMSLESTVIDCKMEGT